jgi:hypothetical protein
MAMTNRGYGPGKPVNKLKAIPETVKSKPIGERGMTNDHARSELNVNSLRRGVNRRSIPERLRNMSAGEAELVRFGTTCGMRHAEAVQFADWWQVQTAAPHTLRQALGAYCTAFDEPHWMRVYEVVDAAHSLALIEKAAREIAERVLQQDSWQWRKYIVNYEFLTPLVIGEGAWNSMQAMVHGDASDELTYEARGFVQRLKKDGTPRAEALRYEWLPEPTARLLIEEHARSRGVTVRSLIGETDHEHE